MSVTPKTGQSMSYTTGVISSGKARITSTKVTLVNLVLKNNNNYSNLNIGASLALPVASSLVTLSVSPTTSWSRCGGYGWTGSETKRYNWHMGIGINATAGTSYTINASWTSANMNGKDNIW